MDRFDGFFPVFHRDDFIAFPGKGLAQRPPDQIFIVGN
jgi:hypothetical protein